ncbi:hypothetical protein ACFC63_02515 [Streptomyces albidoflavus]
MPDTTTPTRSSGRPTVLVTGATGNLGREVDDRLGARSARVRCLAATWRARHRRPSR